MTKPTHAPLAPGDPSLGYAQPRRDSREGGAGPYDVRRTEVTVPMGDAQVSTNDVIPTCPLCHTSTTVVTVHALREGAYWRCTRCGQMWDAIRLQTAANYARHAESLLART